MEHVNNFRVCVCDLHSYSENICTKMLFRFVLLVSVNFKVGRMLPVNSMDSVPDRAVSSAVATNQNWQTFIFIRIKNTRNLLSW